MDDNIMETYNYLHEVILKQNGLVWEQELGECQLLNSPDTSKNLIFMRCYGMMMTYRLTGKIGIFEK